MQRLDAIRLKRNWGALVQTVCICVQTPAQTYQRLSPITASSRVFSSSGAR